MTSDIFSDSRALIAWTPLVAWWFSAQRASKANLWCSFVVNLDMLQKKQLNCWSFETFLKCLCDSIECCFHYNDVIVSPMGSQITNLTIVCSSVYSDLDQRKHQSSTSLVFVRGIHRWPVNPSHKGPVTWKMFPFDDVIMFTWLSIALVFPESQLILCRIA